MQVLTRFASLDEGFAVERDDACELYYQRSPTFIFRSRAAEPGSAAPTPACPPQAGETAACPLRFAAGCFARSRLRWNLGD